MRSQAALVQPCPQYVVRKPILDRGSSLAETESLECSKTCLVEHHLRVQRRPGDPGDEMAGPESRGDHPGRLLRKVGRTQSEKTFA